MIIKHYCAQCGEEIIPFPIEASKVTVIHYGWGDRMTFRLDAPFDRKTGEKNMAVLFQCPNFEKKFFGDNGHDQYVKYKDAEEWCVKIK